MEFVPCTRGGRWTFTADPDGSTAERWKGLRASARGAWRWRRSTAEARRAGPAAGHQVPGERRLHMFLSLFAPFRTRDGGF